MNIRELLSSDKISSVKLFLKRYLVFVFTGFVLITMATMILTIRHYSNSEPSEQQIDDKKASLKAFKLNDEAVKKIQLLQDKNISIESLFNNGRANPFE